MADGGPEGSSRSKGKDSGEKSSDAVVQDRAVQTDDRSWTVVAIEWVKVVKVLVDGFWPFMNAMNKQVGGPVNFGAGLDDCVAGHMDGGCSWFRCMGYARAPQWGVRGL